MSRVDGYSVKPLRLELKSYVRAGKLHLEIPDDDDILSFHLPLSDLLQDGRVSQLNIAS